MADSINFKTDQDWANAGYQFLCWLNKHNRTYLITNGKDTVVMCDEGNGYCHFDQYEQPIYKIITLSIRENEKWPTHEMFGWYHTEHEAREAIACNSCDMQDCAFNYVLLSRSFPGGYGLRDEELQWYKWNYTDREWETCERPEACNNLMFV